MGFPVASVEEICEWAQLLSCIWLCMMLDTKISTWFFTMISSKSNAVCLMCTVNISYPP